MVQVLSLEAWIKMTAIEGGHLDLHVSGPVYDRVQTQRLEHFQFSEHKN